ncbi:MULTISPECIES: hypothetical protein [Acidianus]|uniref:Uncharacterized protein n=1 Tax=Candidatus Acidianus copahuensis TaxID=1160895 RepID=A0A031LQ59_9CREN|nr:MULTISPECIES: hypothetical protein [Acidianus]EZQ06850.1 hypothetical protein CM19_05615 [Candidatus Acidianus copahuensis]NON63637.1 hypothetical protein [Acidianus sp. RZ1]
MFSLTLNILEDPQRIRDIFLNMNTVLSDICSPERIGASYVCSPSETCLITISLVEEMPKFSIYVKLESERAGELMELIRKINSKFKNNGIHATLLTSSKISL